MHYVVTYKEVHACNIHVEADSADEARQAVRQMYDDGKLDDQKKANIYFAYPMPSKDWLVINDHGAVALQ